MLFTILSKYYIYKKKVKSFADGIYRSHACNDSLCEFSVSTTYLILNPSRCVPMMEWPWKFRKLKRAFISVFLK